MEQKELFELVLSTSRIGLSTFQIIFSAQAVMWDKLMRAAFYELSNRCSEYLACLELLILLLNPCFGQKLDAPV